MPLVRIDAIEGRTKEEVKTLLDAAHRAVLSALAVPQRDRYQVYHEHPEGHLIVEDTGLGIQRTKKVLVITVTSMPRSQDLKRGVYHDQFRTRLEFRERRSAVRDGETVTKNSGGDRAKGYPSQVPFRGKLGLPLGGRGCRSTPDLCLWAHAPRRGVTIPANSDSVTVYGSRRTRVGVDLLGFLSCSEARQKRRGTD
jgi:hypothetical protein